MRDRTVRPTPPSALLPVLAALLLGSAACSTGAPTPDAPLASKESLDTILAHADGAFEGGDYEEAQATYEQALKRAPEDGHVVSRLATCYLKNRLVKRAEEVLTRYLEGHGSDRRALLVLARVLLRQGRLEPAATALREVLKGDPDDLLARYNLGFIAYRSRNYPEAETHLRRAIELSPGHPEAHYRLGVTLLAQNRLDDAIAALSRAVEVDPKHVGAHFNLANACARAGRTGEAKKHLDRYAELSGRSEAEEERKTQIATLTVGALQHLMNDRFEEALAEYSRVSALYPDDPMLHKEIGRLQLKLGRNEEALAALRRAVELDPRLSDAHYLLANLYRKMGDLAAAERELETFAMLETIPEGKSGY